MSKINFISHGKQAIIFNQGDIPRNASELLAARVFHEVLKSYLAHLVRNNSPLLMIFPKEFDRPADVCWAYIGGGMFIPQSAEACSIATVRF